LAFVTQPLRIVSPCIANPRLLIKHTCSWPFLYLWRQYTSRQGHSLMTKMCITFCVPTHLYITVPTYFDICQHYLQEATFNSLPNATINIWASIQKFVHIYRASSLAYYPDQHRHYIYILVYTLRIFCLDNKLLIRIWSVIYPLIIYQNLKV